MDRFRTRKLRSPAVAAATAALVLASGGCSSTHHRTLRPGASGGSGLETSTTQAGAVTTETSTTVGGTSATTRTSATTLANRPSGTLPLNTGSSPSNAAPSPATPGTYTMDQSGTMTPGSYTEPPQGTLVVDPAQANGIQVYHRHVDQSNPPANTTTQYLSSGPVILSTTEGAGAQGISCTFNPPIAAPPWPPAAGKTFSARGDCGNGNTVTIQGRISGSQVATLKDGETFTVWVIDSTVTISGQINGSGTQVDWYSPALRLPVHEQTDVQGNFGAIPFTFHTVSDLVSSRPT